MTAAPTPIVRVSRLETSCALGSWAAAGWFWANAGDTRQAASAAVTRWRISRFPCFPGTMTGVKLSGKVGSLPSVARPRVGREIFVVFAFLALVLVGVGRAVLLARDVGPFGGEIGVELEPFLEAALGIGKDRF